jgi:hypothetical protein
MIAGKPLLTSEDLLRNGVLLAAGAGILLGLYFLYGAASSWTSFPANPIVIGYFAVTLIGLPLLAIWSFVLAYREERVPFAAILAAIPLAIYALRYFLFSPG